MLGQLTIPQQKNEPEWKIVTGELDGALGVHAIWLVFYSHDKSGERGMSLDWIQFR